MKVKFKENCQYFNFAREANAKKGDVVEVSDTQVAESLIKQGKCEEAKAPKKDKKDKKDDK